MNGESLIDRLRDVQGELPDRAVSEWNTIQQLIELMETGCVIISRSAATIRSIDDSGLVQFEICTVTGHRPKLGIYNQSTAVHRDTPVDGSDGSTELVARL